MAAITPPATATKITRRANDLAVARDSSQATASAEITSNSGAFARCSECIGQSLDRGVAQRQEHLPTRTARHQHGGLGDGEGLGQLDHRPLAFAEEGQRTVTRSRPMLTGSFGVWRLSQRRWMVTSYVPAATPGTSNAIW
jgi:hypothetical protein